MGKFWIPHSYLNMESNMGVMKDQIWVVQMTHFMVLMMETFMVHCLDTYWYQKLKLS